MSVRFARRTSPTAAASLGLLALLTACRGDQKVGVYNAAPSVSIQSPADGTAFNEGELVEFVGMVSDDQTAAPDLTLQWTSDVDGLLSDTDPAESSGQATFSTASLTVGNHAVTLAATDAQGEREEYTIGLTIVDVPDAPTINVVHPGSGESGRESEDFTFVVQVSDEQDAADTLYVAFESDVDGVFCEPQPDAVGVAECDHALSAGDHTLTFSVTDTSGLVTSATYYFTVIAGTEIDNDGDGYTESQGDCNDRDASVNPVALEYYNDRDDDCDGLIDDGTVNYDDDGDGQSEMGGDCNDASTATYTGAPEACDSADNDCDGIIDETTTCYDDDGDGLSEVDGDCDDGSAISYPGAPEVEDGADNDCDGIIDEGTNAFDDDFDGYTENAGDCDDGNASFNPAATETCNGYDDDCDGTADEVNASGCSTYYYDADGDGYGSSSVSGKCLCSTSGSYTSAYNNDCYDYNSGANPAATSYTSSQRGDGSYDWNCDGTEAKYYTSTFSCSWYCVSWNTGWDGSTPGCGSAGSWGYDCDYAWYGSCSAMTTSLSQACR